VNASLDEAEKPRDPGCPFHQYSQLFFLELVHDLSSGAVQLEIIGLGDRVGAEREDQPIVE